MMENKSRLSRPLVVGQRSDGRCRYDAEAKRELVEACLQPGISVARMALAHGVNANLLRKWIQHYRQPGELVTPSPPTTLSAFAPVLSLGTPKSAEVALGVTLPNGVKLALQSKRLRRQRVRTGHAARLLTAMSKLKVTNWALLGRVWYTRDRGFAHHRSWCLCRRSAQ